MNIASPSFHYKVVRKRNQMTACIQLCLVVLASASFAATPPLSQPRGLAVDAKGNLYVANWAVNQNLIYNPTYQQLTGRTIKTGLNGNEPCNSASRRRPAQPMLCVRCTLGEVPRFGWHMVPTVEMAEQ
ncbi:MAG: hypothetical protein LAP86_00290 [Acidobacteriia bacterium]|nr:hypothetical protein [Terriglobia bacterium]